MRRVFPDLKTATFSPGEVKLAEAAFRALVEAGPDSSVKVAVTQADQLRIEAILPSSAVLYLREVVRTMSQQPAAANDGSPPSPRPAGDEEVTSEQAAAILQVSRSFLLKLVNQNELPCRRVGRYRRIPLAAVLDYKQRNAPAFEGEAPGSGEVH